MSWWAILKPWCYCSSQESSNSWSIFELILTLHCSSIPCVFHSQVVMMFMVWRELKSSSIVQLILTQHSPVPPCWCPGDEKITWALKLSINTCLFISLCTLRDLPQEKNPKSLCLGKIFLFFYILKFLHKESMCGGSCTSGFFCCFETALGLWPQMALPYRWTRGRSRTSGEPTCTGTSPTTESRWMRDKPKAWVMDKRMDARQMKITGAQRTSYINLLSISI